MDARLSPYLTQKEYEHTIGNCNKAMRLARNLSWLSTLILVGGFFLFFFLSRDAGRRFQPEHERCVPPHGECPWEPDLVRSDCCIWECCNEGTRIQKCNEYVRAEKRLSMKDLYVKAEQCVRLHPNQTENCDATVNCVLQMKGNTEIVAERNGHRGDFVGTLGREKDLYQRNFLICFVVCGLLAMGQPLSWSWFYRRWLIEPQLDAWRDKGLSCNYMGSTSNFQGRRIKMGRIEILLPEGHELAVVVREGELSDTLSW